MTKSKFNTNIKAVLVLLAIATAIYTLYEIVNSAEIIIGAISLSIGILALFWTLIAKYSLSPRSTLRLFTNSFLACLIALIALSFLRLMNYISSISGVFFIAKQTSIYAEYFLTTVIYLFFLISAYYILSIGKLFGFQSKASEIKNIISKKKKHYE